MLLVSAKVLYALYPLISNVNIKFFSSSNNYNPRPHHNYQSSKICSNNNAPENNISAARVLKFSPEGEPNRYHNYAEGGIGVPVSRRYQCNIPSRVASRRTVNKHYRVPIPSSFYSYDNPTHHSLRQRLPRKIKTYPETRHQVVSSAETIAIPRRERVRSTIETTEEGNASLLHRHGDAYENQAYVGLQRKEAAVTYNDTNSHNRVRDSKRGMFGSLRMSDEVGGGDRYTGGTFGSVCPDAYHESLITDAGDVTYNINGVDNDLFCDLLNHHNSNDDGVGNWARDPLHTDPSWSFEEPPSDFSLDMSPLQVSSMGELQHNFTKDASFISPFYLSGNNVSNITSGSYTGGNDIFQSFPQYEPRYNTNYSSVSNQQPGGVHINSRDGTLSRPWSFTEHHQKCQEPSEIYHYGGSTAVPMNYQVASVNAPYPPSPCNINSSSLNIFSQSLQHQPKSIYSDQESSPFTFVASPRM
eukprot:Tbor_TRINITY_DN8296_c0_g1::TRINITY_DN8296_c0_g1_i1::g.15400::m.15400